jgi:hypothetical protein
MTDGAEKAKPVKEDKLMNRLKSKTEIDSYAECYPGSVKTVALHFFCILVM